MTDDIFLAMQGNGLNPEACAIQQGMQRASGESPAEPFAAARGLAQAVRDAERGADELDIDSFKF